MDGGTVVDFGCLDPDGSALCRLGRDDPPGDLMTTINEEHKAILKQAFSVCGAEHIENIREHLRRETPVLTSHYGFESCEFYDGTGG